jgi:hypothetical protein
MVVPPVLNFGDTLVEPNAGSFAFVQRFKRINKQVGIDEELSAHAFHPV